MCSDEKVHYSNYYRQILHDASISRRWTQCRLSNFADYKTTVTPIRLILRKKLNKKSQINFSKNVWQNLEKLLKLKSFTIFFFLFLLILRTIFIFIFFYLLNTDPHPPREYGSGRFPIKQIRKTKHNIIVFKYKLNFS